MKKRLVISVSQMFAMLFISRLVVETTYSNVMSIGSCFWDHILSAAVSFLLVFILIIPIYYLFSTDKSVDIIDNSYKYMEKIGHIIAVIYAVYFLYICVHTLALFKIFLANVINPSVSTEVLLATIVLSACYGAYKGVEGIARAAGIIIFFMVISIIFVGISLFNDIDKLNFTPLLYDGKESFLGGILFMISRSSCIPAMALLFPMAKGNVRNGIIVWNTSIYALISIAVWLMVGSMGDFLNTQMFPVYTAASIAKIGTLEHLDALYLGIWTMGIFIKLALFLMLSGECIKKIVGNKIGRVSVLLFGAIIMFMGIFIDKNAIFSGVFSSTFLLITMIVTGLIIPILCIILKKFADKGENKINENTSKIQI